MGTGDMIDLVPAALTTGENEVDETRFGGVGNGGADIARAGDPPRLAKDGTGCARPA